MATSRSFREFDRRMQQIAQAVVRNTEREVRSAALVADQVVVMATPVDTGRARSNWVTSIGAPVFQNADPPGPGGAGPKAISQGQQVIAQWRVGAGPIFISNSVPYIEPLDRGHSKQAPEGMTAQAVEAASRYLRKVRLLRR